MSTGDTTTVDSKSETGGVEGSRLQLHGVSKSFGPVVALSDVSFNVVSGEVHGLIGENGAGKSTLMAVASGALRPDAGTVTIDGTAVLGDPSLSRALGLAIVRQHPALLSELSVADNLMLSVAPSERPRPGEAVRWARECLNAWDERPDIDPRVRVSTLNPEQKFVLEISRALFLRPGVLILDEPSEHLGAEGVERLFKAVRELAAAGSAIVYISHRIQEVKQISDRVTILRDGVIRGTRVTAELNEAEIVSLVIGRSLDATFPEKAAAVAEAGSSQPTLVVDGLSGTAFRDVSFSIRPGEIVGLAGIDDNGQTEVARALAGLDSSTGVVRVLGRKVGAKGSPAAVRAGIAYIPADRHKEGIYPELSVRENVMIRSISKVSNLGVVSSEREQRTMKEALARYAVKSGHPENSISPLSGGNQQKVVLAGALLSEPKVVIADQPTQGVDVGAKAEIYGHLRAIASAGNCVLVLSSDNNELAGICDRVLILSRGRLVAELEGDQVTEGRITDVVLRADSTREHHRRTPSRWARFTDSDLAPAPVLGVLIIALAVFAQLQNANYLSARNIATVLGIAAILAIASAGQSVAILRGGIDLSVGPLMSVVVVISSFYVVDDVGFGYHIMGWALVLGVSLLVGVANWAMIDRLKIHPMLATFGTWMVLEAVSLTLRPSPAGLISSGVALALSFDLGVIPAALIVAVVVIIGAEVWRTRTMGGKLVQAVGSSSTVAEKLGISESRATFVAYVMCSMLAGVAGIFLIGQVGSGDATAGSLFTLQSVAAAVVGGLSLFGGRGSFIGVLFASILLTQVRSITTFLSLDDAWQHLLLAFITIGAVFLYSIARRRTTH